MIKMVNEVCDVCNLKIEGHNKKEISYNMEQHKLMHKRMEERKKLKEERRRMKECGKNT